MIRVICDNCGSKLNAKPKLAGQMRQCPKCGEPILIPADVAEENGPAEGQAVTNGIPLDEVDEDAPPTPITFANPAVTALPSKNLLKRLSRANRYLICDKHNVRAAWNNDGRGWMLKISSGFSPVKVNQGALPAYGSFTLVELVMKHTEDGIKLDALEIYELSSRGSMSKLEQGDDNICEAITDRCPLSRDQKAAIYQVFKTLFMREVWGDSKEVIDFLLNADYHSTTSRGTEELDREL
ncbi:MAG: hypothetical protein PVH19_08010 [Planctomycetia bacterium]|jgi:hypothetical protein